MKLEEYGTCEVSLPIPCMPDPFEAKRSIWLPYIRDVLIGEGNNHRSIIVGHSSGAVAAMRLLEETNIYGAVLISACHTDLGEPNERISGYYPGFKEGSDDPNPWDFESMKKNSQFVLQFHSTDDPFIPIEEADYVAKEIASVYRRYDDRSHFFTDKDVDDIIECIHSKCLEFIGKNSAEREDSFVAEMSDL